MSQPQIAEQLGVSVAELNRILSIDRKLTPEIKELLDTGIISKTSASKIWTRLSQQEQLELLQELGKDAINEMTQSQVEQYIKQKKLLEEENKQLKQMYAEEKNKKVQVKEKIIDNTDYSTIDNLIRQLNNLKE